MTEAEERLTALWFEQAKDHHARKAVRLMGVMRRLESGSFSAEDLNETAEAWLEGVGLFVGPFPAHELRR